MMCRDVVSFAPSHLAWKKSVCCSTDRHRLNPTTKENTDMATADFRACELMVEDPAVHYSDETIVSHYSYRSTSVTEDHKIRIQHEELVFKTQRKVPRLGMMLVGWGGNNGSTLTAGCLANRYDIKWNTKDGIQTSNFYGSLTQSSTIRIGIDQHGRNSYIPFKNILPMVDPKEIIIGGWDISSMNLADAMSRAKVLDYDLQTKLHSYMENMVPLPGIYKKDFIASNQSDRADNILSGNSQENLETIRANIRDFKRKNSLDKVIVLWTATTERFSDVIEGVNDTADHLLRAIKVRHHCFQF